MNTTKTAGSTGAERNLLNRNLQEGIKKQKKKVKSGKSGQVRKELGDASEPTLKEKDSKRV